MAEDRSQCSLVHPGADGKLVYVPDERGDTIPDFSNAGYGGGGVPLPQVETHVTVEPRQSGDDTERIQAAIDEVASLARDRHGIRGALLLKRGAYRVGGSLKIAASGVVLRGEGDGEDGTVLIATGKGQRALIRIEGEGGPQEVEGRRQAIVDAYVPVGARSFEVASSKGFVVGEQVVVHRPSAAEWIHAIGMDRIEMSHPDVKQWRPGTCDFRFDRMVTAIDGNVITVDAPVGNAFQEEYGGGCIYPYAFPGRIEQVGIESIRAISEFDNRILDERKEGEYADEDHGWDLVLLDRVQNAWVRNVTSVHFGYACVKVLGRTKWVTIQDCGCLDPVSEVRGSRRYSFPLSGQLALVQRCLARRGRHDFVLHAWAPGPNVFLDGLAETAFSDSGPHHRWSMATLFDNVVVRGNAINVQDRQGSGTGHGWAGSQKVLWNCVADRIACQKPPTSQNHCIGCIAEKDPGWHPREDGHWESHGQPVTPRSLYLTQLEDRLGMDAVREVATDAQIDGTILRELEGRLAD